MNERLDLDAEDAPWVYTLARRIAAARASGDEDEATRLIDYGRAESGQALSQILTQLVAALGEQQAALERGAVMTPFAISAAQNGELICDFCTAPGPVAYYEVSEFGIGGPGATFMSGDRFYACPRCRELVDAANWKALRDWIGPKQFGLGTRMLLVGFKSHRKGDAVEFEPGTNPEAGR